MEIAFGHLWDFIPFAVTSAPPRREEAGAGLGSCGERCAGELPLRALVRKWSQGPDPQRCLGTYRLFDHLPTLILNRSWEHNCLGKFWMTSVPGRGQAGSSSVRCNSFQFALHERCALSMAEIELTSTWAVLFIVSPFIFSTSERSYREST